MKAKLPSIQVIDQNMGKLTYAPFENELDLCCLARIEKDNRVIGAFLLNQGDIADENKFQVVFAFHCAGIHTQLYKEEVLGMSSGISEAMKFIPPGERVTFLLGRYSDDSDRQQYLSRLAETGSLKLPAILVRNEQARIQELTRKGTRSTWKQMLFCTWTSDEFGERKNDPLSGLIYHTGKTCRFLLDSITGRLSDLRRFDLNERTQRLKSWRSFIRNALGIIVMGRLNAPHLAQRVDAILMQALDLFLSDPDIIERYNSAFNQGWKSAQWQEIPTLKDFLRFCSIARLDIRKPEAIDHQATSN